MPVAATLVLAAGLGLYLIVHGLQGGDTTPALTYDGLMSRLRAAGATVAPGDVIEQPFLAVRGRFLKVNDAEVQVFEYPSVSAAAAEAARVVPDGCAVGTAVHINWIAPPHFYRQGQVIVLVIGGGATLLNLLSSVLGPQFAGARAEETEVPGPPCP